MNKGARATDAVPPPLPDLGPLMVGPLTALRMWADVSRAAASVMPATLMIAMAPFFWAPPVWVGLLMAAPASPRHDSQARALQSSAPRGFTTIGISR